MKTVVIESTNAGPQLVFRTDVPEPAHGANDLRVRVRMTALDFADLARRATHYGHAAQQQFAVAGLELAGEVTALGANVRGFALGNRVMAMASRAYAEVATVDYRIALKVHASYTWDQAAATSVSYLTALDATDQCGADVIVDNVGGGMLDALMRSAAIKGRIVSIGRLNKRTDQIDLDELARKRIKLIGVTFGRARSTSTPRWSAARSAICMPRSKTDASRRRSIACSRSRKLPPRRPT